jgi:hypothetical protein
MSLKLEQISLKPSFLLIEEEPVQVQETQGGVRLPQETIDKLKKEKFLRIGKVIKSHSSVYTVDTIIIYQFNSVDRFDLPVEGYENLKTIKSDYIIGIINYEESSNN